MVRGSRNRKSQNTHNQGTPQKPLAKKLPTLNNDIPTPSTATSSDNRSADHAKLKEEQQKVVESMQEKIHALETKVYELEGRIIVMQTVNSHLQNMVDAQEQYSRQSCLIINGMAKPEHEEGADNSDDVSQVIETLERECGISPDIMKNILDKTHPIGRPDEYGKQLRVVKFTTNNFKEMVFRKRKQRRNSYTERQKSSGKPVQIKGKLQPSLTRQQLGLLKFANSQLEGAKNFKFAYADMHGTLQVMLKTPVRNKSILEFKTKIEVMEILHLADGLDEDAYEGIYEQ